MKTIEEFRAEFEKAGKIRKRIKQSSMIFDDGLDEYHTKSIENCDVYNEVYVNGAWMMFQRLKK